METGRGNFKKSESRMKSWNMTRMNIPVMHLLKSWTEKTGINVFWSQGPGLVSKQMSKTIILRRIINNVVLPSVRRIAVIWTRIRSE